MLRAYKPFSDFDSAAQSLLDLLHEQYGFSLWMVTRTDGVDWTVLQSKQHTYGVSAGDVFSWTDSFCSRMVQGLGPCIAPDARSVDAYADAPVSQQLDIGAYIGIPLSRPDGSLFGTLCAIDPQPQPADLVDELPRLIMASRMLSTILATELKAEAEMRRANHAEAEAETDALTNAFNRRGWDRMLSAEESRCHRYGHIASIIAIDLDDFKNVNDSQGHSAGDRTLMQVAQALERASRACDVVARTGGDEFAIIAVECDEFQSAQFIRRIKENLSQFNIQASIGTATRSPTMSLDKAWIQADKNMYEKKQNATGILRALGHRDDHPHVSRPPITRSPIV
ncbi:sensor domain-containing diguanylate cyclase [Planctomycetes bacterium K23_9]|uniref:diguanylate cyclase n=1 Tax=Stieleria marina TaxID=1930275 RepID=A0A517NRL5_9BACT|nr:putative diguanylate cyclase YeaP [Planctomycetes bacterium K23_9]